MPSFIRIKKLNYQIFIFTLTINYSISLHATNNNYLKIINSDLLDFNLIKPVTKRAMLK